MKEDSISFSYSIISLSTPSLTLPQTSSDSNKSNENTVSVKASDFKNVNTQSENVKPNTEFAQSFNDFVEEEIDD